MGLCATRAPKDPDEKLSSFLDKLNGFDEWTKNRKHIYTMDAGTLLPITVTNAVVAQLADKFFSDSLCRDLVWDFARPALGGSCALDLETFFHPQHLYQSFGFHLWLIDGQLVISEVGGLMSLTAKDVRMSPKAFLVLYQTLIDELNDICEKYGRARMVGTQFTFEEPYIVLKRPPTGLDVMWTIHIYDRRDEIFVECFKFSSAGVFISAREFVGLNSLVTIDQEGVVENALGVFTKHDDQWTMRTVPLHVLYPVTCDFSPRVVRFRYPHLQFPVALLSCHQDDVFVYALERHGADVFVLRRLIPMRVFGQCIKDRVIVGEAEQVFMSLCFEDTAISVDPFYFEFSEGKRPMLFHITQDRKLVAATLAHSKVNFQVEMQFAEYPRL